MCKKVIEMTKPFETKTKTSSALGSPCAAVGGRWLDWKFRYSWSYLYLDGIGDFPSLLALTEDAR